MKGILEKNWVKGLISLILTFGIVQVLISTNIINDYLQSTLATICINIILAVSLNLITGFTGQFSLGHAGFMSIGAYVCALITLNNRTIPGFILGVFAGAIVAAIVGFLVGLPTLRLKGDYLAIATLGMAEIIRIIFTNLDSITNGPAGLQDIPSYKLALAVLYTAGTIIIISNFIISSHGRSCISIREDEIASEAMGINSTKNKVTAFTIGAFFAGIAGALYASTFNFINPKIFDFSKSINILVIVVLGGLGSISGSVIAAIVLEIINTYLQSFADIQMILYSLLLVIIMIFRPQGLMGSKEISFSVFGKLSSLFAPKKGRV